MGMNTEIHIIVFPDDQRASQGKSGEVSFNFSGMTDAMCMIAISYLKSFVKRLEQHQEQTSRDTSTEDDPNDIAEAWRRTDPARSGRRPADREDGYDGAGQARD